MCLLVALCAWFHATFTFILFNAKSVRQNTGGVQYTQYDNYGSKLYLFCGISLVRFYYLLFTFGALTPRRSFIIIIVRCTRVVSFAVDVVISSSVEQQKKKIGTGKIRSAKNSKEFAIFIGCSVIFFGFVFDTPTSANLFCVGVFAVALIQFGINYFPAR